MYNGLHSNNQHAIICLKKHQEKIKWFNILDQSNDMCLKILYFIQLLPGFFF